MSGQNSKEKKVQPPPTALFQQAARKQSEFPTPEIALSSPHLRLILQCHARQLPLHIASQSNTQAISCCLRIH